MILITSCTLHRGTEVCGSHSDENITICTCSDMICIEKPHLNCSTMITDYTLTLPAIVQEVTHFKRRRKKIDTNIFFQGSQNLGAHLCIPNSRCAPRLFFQSQTLISWSWWSENCSFLANIQNILSKIEHLNGLQVSLIGAWPKPFWILTGA